MRHDKYKEERIFDDFYMSNKAGETDLQESYFDEWKLRSIVNDRFRELIRHRNSKLLQALPVRKQHELKNISRFITLEDEIETLTLKAKIDSATKDRRETLMIKKRKLISEKLLKCQKLQSSRLFFNDDVDLISYHRI